MIEQCRKDCALCSSGQSLASHFPEQNYSNYFKNKIFVRKWLMFEPQTDFSDVPPARLFIVLTQKVSSSDSWPISEHVENNVGKYIIFTIPCCAECNTVSLNGTQAFILFSKFQIGLKVCFLPWYSGSSI